MIPCQMLTKGPLVNGGSDGDNGQAGRKLVIDFYGPRVPIGGGALSGKHLSHIDRIGACAARDAAVRAVQSGGVLRSPGDGRPVLCGPDHDGPRAGSSLFRSAPSVERRRKVNSTAHKHLGPHAHFPAPAFRAPQKRVCGDFLPPRSSRRYAEHHGTRPHGRAPPI